MRVVSSERFACRNQMETNVAIALRLKNRLEGLKRLHIGPTFTEHLSDIDSE